MASSWYIKLRLPFLSRYFCRSIGVRGRWNTFKKCYVCQLSKGGGRLLPSRHCTSGRRTRLHEEHGAGNAGIIHLDRRLMELALRAVGDTWAEWLLIAIADAVVLVARKSAILKGRQTGGFQSFFVLFGTFPIFPGFSRFARGWSGDFPDSSLFSLSLSLSLGLLRAPTRNSPERVRDTIWTFPEESGKDPGLETPRFSFSQDTGHYPIPTRCPPAKGQKCT